MPTPAPTVPLRNGAAMPLIGLGTWPMDNAQAAAAVESAVELGYRLFDTAENYRNEEGVGEGLRRSGIDRGEVFITTKFNREWHSYDGVQQAFANSARRLGVDYIDLLLIHWPNPAQDRFVDAFAGMSRLLSDGRVRAIGVSNFKPAHLQRLQDNGLVPEVNQIQLDPRHTRSDLRALHAELGILTESWSPLGRDSGLLQEPGIVELAEKYGRTPAQIVLRWHTQLGCAATPKSASPERQRQNISVFDFELEQSEVDRLTALDTGVADIYDADVFGH